MKHKLQDKTGEIAFTVFNLAIAILQQNICLHYCVTLATQKQDWRNDLAVKGITLGLRGKGVSVARTPCNFISGYQKPWSLQALAHTWCTYTHTGTYTDI